MAVINFTLWGWSATIVLDLEDTSPLSKVTAVLFVLGTSFAETVQTLGSSFVHASSQWDNTLVDLNFEFRPGIPVYRFDSYLDTEKDTSFLQIVNDWFSFIIFLVKSFVEENAATKRFTDDLWCL